MADAPAFRYGEAGADPARTVFVDGTVDGFRSLSHWPGNTTPGPFKRDLSTQICLAWAAATPAVRDDLLGAFDEVANNHYDTDGVLSVFSVMHPEIALAHRDLLERTAATGDFAVWRGPDALALELTVMSVTSHPASPLAGRCPPGAPDAARWETGYRWLLDELPALLKNPFALEQLWSERHRRVCREIAAIESGAGPVVQRHPDLDLALVETSQDLSSIALHHAAGDLYRMLLVQPGKGGWRYRFCYRDESWFETVDIRHLPRVALDSALAELQRHERAAGGDLPGDIPTADGSRGERPAAAGWWVSDLAVPIVELRHSSGPAGNPFTEDPWLSRDAPSRLVPEEVFEVLAGCLAAG